MENPVSANSASSLQNSEERLKAMRLQIDEVDKKLLTLLNERASLSLEVGKIKSGSDRNIFKPLREHELLETLSAINPGILPNSHLRSIWRAILGSSRALQQPQKIAYLGPLGTFSYFAARQYLGEEAHFEPCRDINEIFEKVTSKICSLGVVPLENSLQGTVGVSIDLFLVNNVIIEAEFYYRISQSLLSNAPDLKAIKKIYSHPQPLAQCGKWLRANLPYASLIPVESTAAAAKRASPELDAAAIGNINLASMYNLKVMATHIEDNRDNWTRFVIITLPGEKGRSPNSVANKTSLIFTIPDKPGTLSKVLDLIGRNGLNMRKLESRPKSGQPWKYVFFADIENNLQNPDFRSLLEQLDSACLDYRILGSYPFGDQLDDLSE